MKLDIQLDHTASKRRIIIDTKFTQILKPGYRKDSTLASGYIYQMYAYLRSREGRGDPLADSAEGILLHPAIGDTDAGGKPAMLNEWADIQGHRIRFATVDLTGSARAIRAQLLAVIGLADV